MKNLTPTTLINAEHIHEGAKLEADAYFQNSETLALLCHPNPKAGGNMINKVVTTMYRFCKEQGMDVVRFNYRGVGKSDGQIQYGDGEFFDALCVLDWACQHSHAKTLWLGGFSFGGFIACRVANEILLGKFDKIPLQKLTLIAPSIEKNDPSNLILDKHNTLMIYGDKDEFVRPSSMANFANDFGIKSKVIAGASHFFHGQLDELKQALEV